MSPRTTIRDIAKETGLSITAVSLVLNERPNKISEESRSAIRQTAARLNYISNQQKRMSRTKRLGVVVPDMTNFFFANLISGVDSVASQDGHQLLFGFTNNEPERELHVIKSLYAQGMDGLIITPSTATTSSGYHQLFQTNKTPVILVDRVHPSFSHSSLTYNHRKGAYFAVSHLLDLGHKRIACLSGDGELSNSASQRVDGYRWAFEARGLAVHESSIFCGDYLPGSSYRIADEILSRGFTALFSCNDMMAYGFYKRAKELNRSIPGDISVVGYDDLFFSNLLDPPLTTVRQDAYHLGREAITRLMTEIEDPHAQRQEIHFEPTLMIRNSTQAVGWHRLSTSRADGDMGMWSQTPGMRNTMK